MEGTDTAAEAVTNEEVLWAYRFLLGREPESEAAIDAHLKLPDRNALRRHFMASAEFQSKLNRTEQSRWVIAPIAGGRLLAWIDLADHYVSAGMLFDRFEPHITCFIAETLRPGDVFYDVGANLGWHTLHAALAVGPRGHVHAFEPRPDLAARLRASVALNELEPNVTVHEVAVGAAAGHSPIIAVPDERNPGHSYLGTPRDGEVVIAEVEVVALDSLGLEPPTLIKMDVEGAEGLVLAGARDILSKHLPLIACEIFPAFLERVSGVTVEKFMATVQDLSYIALPEKLKSHTLGTPFDLILTPIDFDAMSRPTHRKAHAMQQLPPPIRAEIFRGYTIEDANRMEALVGDHAPLQSERGIVDWFGIKIASRYAPWIDSRSGQVIDRPPFPDDTFLAEGIEYAALGLALERAKGRGRFCSLEIGAGWGPWTALSATCALRAGFKSVTIGAFEADVGRFAQLRQHLALNGLVPSDAPDKGMSGVVTHELEQAAIWWENTTLYWPEASESDSGRTVSIMAEEGSDYRGYVLHASPIRALGLPGVLERFDRVDFLHVDIQGAEAEVIPKSIEALESKVSVMFIGTHSRKIEGDLLEFLYNRCWRLLREQPCVFDPEKKVPTFQALTLRDGGLVWQAPGI